VLGAGGNQLGHLDGLLMVGDHVLNKSHISVIVRCRFRGGTAVDRCALPTAGPAARPSTSMHIHGGPFTVVATYGITLPKSARYQKDTVNVGPAERYDVIWTAREPGKWLLHCHINHLGAPIPRTAETVFAGRLRLRPRGPWLPFGARETLAAASGFVFSARARLGPRNGRAGHVLALSS